MGVVWLCRCRCHATPRADWNAARQMEDFYGAMLASSDPLINANIPVDAKDPLEAAVACEVCKGNHAIVFSDTPPPFDPPQDWDPQADGEG